MRVFFIDLETTGFNPYRDYIWQVAWCIGEERRGEIYITKGGERLLLPEGRRFAGRLSFLISDIRRADLLVAHNVSFELSFLRAYGIEVDKEKTFCTMMASRELCDIKTPQGTRKYPKLSEAVEILLGVKPNPEWLHDAGYDLYLTIKLYAYIKKIQTIQFPKWQTPPKDIKNLYRLLFSALEPYKSLREKMSTEEKIHALRKIREYTS